MEELLKIDNLILSFHGPRGKVTAVKGVNLEIRPGETLALVGESGCGKTALCRAVMMLHSQHAEIESGTIRLCGNDVTGMSETELENIRGRDAAMIFQDPMTSLNPTLSVGRQIMEPIRIHGKGKVTKAEAKARALELLRLVEIDNPEVRFKQYPHHMSGGMRQRVAAAIALACNPGLIIADEPTTALDISTQDKIMALLKKLCTGGGRGMLFVTHDLGLALTAADRIAVMKDGVIVETGRTAEIFSNPQHEYTKKLLGYASYGKASSHFHGGIKAAGGEPFCGENLIQIRGLTKLFEMGKSPARPVLQNIDLTVKKGEILGIVGPSGCGKSTLARCIMGIYKPTAGQIEIREGCSMQMIFQDSASAFNPRMTIAEIIAEPLAIRRDKTGTKEQKVFSLMEQVGLERELSDRHPYDVSGGQRQRAAIARALITNPDILIADEPIASLDVSIQSQIIHLLKKLAEERNLTILLIAHDLPMVEHISDRMISLDSSAVSDYNKC